MRKRVYVEESFWRPDYAIQLWGPEIYMPYIPLKILINHQLIANRRSGGDQKTE
jgi:hypothetical protein